MVLGVFRATAGYGEPPLRSVFLIISPPSRPLLLSVLIRVLTRQLTRSLGVPLPPPCLSLSALHPLAVATSRVVRLI